MKLTIVAQQYLVEKHLPIARALAHKYRGQGVPIPDLFQEASVGLVEAAKRFDPELTPVEHFGEYARSQAMKRVIQAIDAELENRLSAELAEPMAEELDPHAERAAEELWSAAEILGPFDRELLADRYGLDGRIQRGVNEISATRNIPVRTLTRRLDDIRQQLKLELVQRGWRGPAKVGASVPVQAQLNTG